MDVLLARRNEIDVRVQALQIEMETARLWAQLNFLYPSAARAARGRLACEGSPMNTNRLAIAARGRAGHRRRRLRAVSARPRPGHAIERRDPCGDVGSADAYRRAGARRATRPCDRQEGSLLARPDGAGPEIRQARQVAVHGHGAGAGLCRSGRRRRATSPSARACSRTSACARRRSRSSVLAATVEAVGSVAYNERDVAVVQARSGRLHRAPVRARAARPGAPGPAARGALRARLGGGAGRIPVGQRACAAADRRPASMARASACASPA